MSITIRDVAKEANASISSVSRYINSPEMLSEKMQSNVKGAIEKLNFRPNPLAVSMRTNKTKNIAFMIPTITNMYYVDLYEKLHDAAQRKGYSLSLYTTNYDHKALIKYLGLPFRHLYDGTVVAFLDEPEVRKKMKSIGLHVPLVLITSDPKHIDINNVFVDAYDAIRQATSYLLTKGRQSIGYIGAVYESVISKEKLKGFISVIEEAGLQVDSRNIFHGARQHFITGMKGVDYFISNGRLPDGIVCSTDDVGIGCIKRLTKLGISVPEQTSVIGFNGISILDSYEPELITVAQPLKDIADSAVELLVENILNSKHEKRRIYYKGTLRERVSI